LKLYFVVTSHPFWLQFFCTFLNVLGIPKPIFKLLAVTKVCIKIGKALMTNSSEFRVGKQTARLLLCHGCLAY